MTAAQSAHSHALRDLRLWHWRELGKARALANRLPLESARPHHTAANLHLGFVQLLNDFFPAGDTAERDARAAALDDHTRASQEFQRL